MVHKAGYPRKHIYDQRGGAVPKVLPNSCRSHSPANLFVFLPAKDVSATVGISLRVRFAAAEGATQRFACRIRLEAFGKPLPEWFKRRMTLRRLEGKHV